ncbi:hypothetical protein M422DRAFT_241123 [Sphaerobolus stellatus SS14]|nr:hypothetical protein M422DRAFT_241123 [Sphaerobolus stellatus SS14]
MSPASSSSNAAELLSHFHDQQAKRNEHCVEVGAVFDACFVFHPKGCNQCSTYVEHLLADIEQHPAKFSFTKDEIMDGLQEAWPHEKADNHRLRGKMNDLNEKVQELEARLMSLQPSTTTSERSTMLTSPADNSPAVGSAHPLAMPVKNEDFRNRVLKPGVRPNHWSLHMWQALVGWQKNPMSVPNAIRDDAKGYFLEEDIDVAAWLNKIIANNSRPAFMSRMKAVFGSSLAFETIFSGFDSNSLKPAFQQLCWITDTSTPIRLGSQITKGTKGKSQTAEAVKIPQGSEFLALILKHCSLSREQVYEQIIPYMERDEEKRPMSAASRERAAYMSLHQTPPAPNKGKKPLTGSSQSNPSPHAAQPVKTGQSSQQRLDAELEVYNNECEPILPYSEEPPSGEPDVEMHGSAPESACGTLPDESTINVDLDLEDLYE